MHNKDTIKELIDKAKDTARKYKSYVLKIDRY